MASALKNSLNVQIGFSSSETGYQVLNPGEITALTEGQIYYVFVPSLGRFLALNDQNYSINELGFQFTESPL